MKRALISVTNKSGVVDFAKGLTELGFEIVSTGGTLKALNEGGVKAIDIENVTGFPEILDGRVKTLHPMVHGGLLFRRDVKEHVETVEKMGITPIDLVCVNLYEFEKALKSGKPMPEMIENIDIGGPSMVRSAAKNYKDVLIVTDSRDYDSVLDAIKNDTADEAFRLNLAYKAFSTTAAYDSMISRYFAEQVGDEFPETLNLSFKKVEHLRYGENSQQAANKYEDTYVTKSLLDYEQLNGKEISFNNVNDLYGAVAVVREYGNQIVTAAIKHSTPCGVAIGNTVFESYSKAYEADPQSIFGGIVATNGKIDKATAEKMHDIFLEIVAAPDFDDDALEILKTKKNLRILKLKNLSAREAKYDAEKMHDIFLEIVAAPDFDDDALEILKTKKNLRILKLKNLSAREAKYDIKYLEGKVLVQELNKEMIKEMNVVTEAKPSEAEMSDMEFGMRVVKYVKSNAVCIVKNGVTLAIGGGQTSRVWALENAIHNNPDKDFNGAVVKYVKSNAVCIVKNGVTLAIGGGQTSRVWALENAIHNNPDKDFNGAVLASDAFFPFNDCVEVAHKAGITAVVQPGGSVRDQDSIDLCNEYGMSMVFTGYRHFRH